MSSNPLMMGYGGGDLLLAAAAGCWVTTYGLCVQALGGDLNTAWRLSFSDKSALEVLVTQEALYKLTSHLCQRSHFMSSRVSTEMGGHSQGYHLGI